VRELPAGGSAGGDSESVEQLSKAAIANWSKAGINSCWSKWSSSWRVFKHLKKI